MLDDDPVGIGGSSRGRRQKQGDDVVHSLKVSLEDLYNGTSKKLSLSKNVLCPKCKGYYTNSPHLSPKVNYILVYMITLWTDT